MTETVVELCPHCGLPDTYDAEHRACRLKARFPGAYSQDGALVTFDMGAIAESIGLGKPIHTRSGLKFERYRDEVWVSAEVQIGNTISSWSWELTKDEWAAITAAITFDAEPLP